jgi:uncharacterized protein involved in exopolysaccharide biosynthesis
MDINEFLNYWRVIKKRLWLILLIFLATMGVILATSLTAAPVYRASVKVQIIGSEPQQVSLFGQVRSASVSEELAAVQAEFRSVLSSGLVAWRTIASLNLSISAADLLAGITSVEDGDSMIVTAESDTPQLAEAIINAHVDNAIQYYRDYRALPARVTKQFLVQQVDAQGEILAEAKDALLKFKLKNNVDSMERELVAYQDMIRAYKNLRDTALIEEQRNLSEAASYRAAAEATRAELERVAPADTSAAYASYLDTIRVYQRQAAEFDAAASGQKTAAREYDQLIAQKEAELLALVGFSKEADALARAVSLAEQNYNFLLSKANEAQLKEATAQGVGYIQVVEKARTPDAPAKSNLPRLAAVGAVASLLAGIILAFVIEMFESLGRSVTSRERR